MITVRTIIKTDRKRLADAVEIEKETTDELIIIPAERILAALIDNIIREKKGIHE